MKLNVFLKSKKLDQARKRADDVIAHAVKLEDAAALRTIATTLRGPLAKESKEILSLSAIAAEASLKAAGDDDPLAILDVANSHFALGDSKKVLEYGTKALAAAEKDPATFRSIVLTLRTTLAKGNNDVLIATLKSAESGLKTVGNTSALAIANVADAHFALGDKEKAVEFGMKALAAAENDPPAFRTVATLLRDSVAKGDRDVLTNTLKKAESALKVAGSKNAVALLNVADAHFALGNKQKALEFGARAVLAAENEPPAIRRSIGQQVQTYEAKRKTTSKDEYDDHQPTPTLSPRSTGEGVVIGKLFRRGS
jgi:tetratricopeptide (TPR) repeat protein